MLSKFEENKIKTVKDIFRSIPFICITICLLLDFSGIVKNDFYFVMFIILLCQSVHFAFVTLLNEFETP